MKKIVCIICSGILFASTNDATLVFLTIYPGARAVGMGGAFASIAEDATALYYNPGGIAFFEKNEVSLQHSNWLTGLWPDMYYEFLGFVRPLPPYGNMGIHGIYLTTGETEAQLEDGTTIARFRNFDFAIGASYGVKIWEKLGIGFTAKIVYSFLAPDWLVRIYFPETGGGGAALSYAFDFGLLYKFDFPKGLQFGTSLLHIGPPVKFTKRGGDKDPIPYTLKTGFSYRPVYNKAHKIILATEITKVIVNLFKDLKDDGFKEVWKDTWKNIGLEYTYYDFISARIGYFEDLAGRRVGWTYGGSLIFKSFIFDVGVDSDIYSFETDNYRFSFGYKF
ncbi:MAG: PorV/PorQ family protein [candidate division WOR-3 bacterium]